VIRRLIRYRVFVRMAVQEAMAFRAQFWGSLAVSGLTLLLSYYLWSAIYGGQQELAGIRLQQMMTYLVVSALVNGALIGGTIAYLGGGFMTGSLGGELIRPLSFPLLCLARSTGSAAVYLILRGLPVFVLGAVFIGIRWPSPAAGAAFLASLFQAFVLYFLLEFCLAQLTLFTHTHRAVSQLWGLVVTFATGALIPLPFFPAGLREVLYVLPFQSVFYTPINIFLGGELEVGPVVGALVALGLPPVAAAVACQTLWIAVLVPLAAGAWRFSSPRLLVQGG
jgi:ABC-2 type transport system permease protein